MASVKNSTLPCQRGLRDKRGCSPQLPGDTFMKATLAALVLSLSFATTSFAAESVVYTIKGHEVLTLKKISKTKFDKISQVVTGSASLDYVSPRGSRNIMSQDINEAGLEYVSLEITGKNILRVVDVKENINQEIPATINTSLFGSVKKISIDSKTMEGLYAASMKKAGLDTLRALKLFGGAVQSTINTSSMECTPDGDLLICQQDQSLVFTLK